jgi:hypothetical protein
MVSNVVQPSLVLIAIALGGSTAGANAPSVRHVPPAGALAASTIELVAEAPATSPALTVHYRPSGTVTYATAELVRQGDTRWVVVVPAAAVMAPGLEYYLAAGGAPVFASAAHPHATPVTISSSADRRARDERRVQNKRSRIRTAGEYVNYGSARDPLIDQRLKDSYYRIDADFTYRLWAYPLEELRVGYTRLIGTTRTEDATACNGAPSCAIDAGFKVAGWFELGLAPVEGVHVDLRAAVMATAEGFAVGGRAEGRLGERDASHVAVGVEYMADVGVSGFFRLGWGTVPGLPMAATVEVTNLPLADRDTGVRLYYDVARDLGGGVRIGGRVGYAARTQLVAGFTGGGNVSVDF